MLRFLNQIINGHVLNVLPQMPAESVYCVITSVPYWGLRDYGIEPQKTGSIDDTVKGGDPTGNY
jgi:DNA modification methylase